MLSFDRRNFLALGVGCTLASASGVRAAQPDGMRVVTMLGDSITAGLGLPADQAVPAQLQQALRQQGLKVVVRPAGVSGDTSADGLARVDFSVKPDTDLCVVALGGNDLLQGVDPKVLKANLASIVAHLKARRIRVLLVGLKAPPAIGAGYAKDFDQAFADAAKLESVSLFPDLLGKVAGDRTLNQGDGVHPNATGVRQIVTRLAPIVAGVLRR